jgi:hypothetical protein
LRGHAIRGQSTQPNSYILPHMLTKRWKFDIPSIAPVNPISKILCSEPVLLKFLGRCWTGFPDVPANFSNSYYSVQAKFLFWRQYWFDSNERLVNSADVMPFSAYLLFVKSCFVSVHLKACNIKDKTLISAGSIIKTENSWVLPRYRPKHAIDLISSPMCATNVVVWFSASHLCAPNGRERYNQNMHICLDI